MLGFAKDVRAAINAAGEFCWQRLDQQGIPPPLRRRYQGQREALRVAIRFGETRFGHLALLFAGRGRPSEARVHAMRALAHQAAVAIGLQRQRENACRGESRAAVEAERTRMAGEIHDGIAQAFLAVLMQARAARLPVRRHGRAVLRFLDGIESAAADGLEEARRSAFALRSVPVARHGLVHALERLVGSFATGGPTRFVFVNGAGAPSPSHAVEDAAYRIVQEAMQNAVKHAGASLVTVRLDRHDDRLRLRIEDDGEGIAQDLVQRARERGGLRGMRERAEQCGGSLVVETGSPRGMRIHVLLPLENTLK
jgi:signal transduction histidine kinase